MKSDKIFPESVNLHITENCNYRCKFCFAKYYNSKKELGCKKFKKIIDALAERGCKKVNFVGGEPTLISFLPDLISYSKDQCLFTSIVLNGTGINENFLKKTSGILDLIGLSVDS